MRGSWRSTAMALFFQATEPTKIVTDLTMSTPWNSDQLEGFRSAAQSLKLYRRAELEDANQKSLIKDFRR